jgi:hypothetical protein
MAGRLCATVCAISFLTLFAFAHVSVAGNYNFVTPYEYEYTHATLLCLACVIFLRRMIIQPRMIDSAVAGFLVGMVFLTRAEFFVAILGAAMVGFAFLAANSRRSFVSFAAAFFLAAAIPPLISILLLRIAMPWNVAVHGTLGMWPALLGGKVSSQLFYRHSMGLDDLPRSLRLMAAWSAAWSIPIAGFAAWALRPKPSRSLPALLIAFLLGSIFAGWGWRHIDWIAMFRPLPIIPIAVITLSTIQFFHRRASAQAAALPAMLAMFSLLLLAKVFLYTRIVHYGCWLAMPATMLLIITLFGWIPSAISSRGGSRAAFCAGIGGTWIVVLLVHLAISAMAMKQLTVSVGLGADQFWADAVRGNCVNNAVLAAGQIPPDKTIACFPEGIIINYLSRRQTATPYVNFNPPDLLLFGEDRIIEAMNNSPPDFVFLVHKDTSEFGERFFGRDYGRKLNDWIEQRYVEETLPTLDLGSEPLRNGQFGIRLMVPRPREESPRRLIYGPGGGDSRNSLAAASISSRE